MTKIQNIRLYGIQIESRHKKELILEKSKYSLEFIYLNFDIV